MSMFILLMDFPRKSGKLAHSNGANLHENFCPQILLYIHKRSAQKWQKCCSVNESM